MGSKNTTQTSTQNQTYSPAALSQLQSIFNTAQGVASQPYQPYGGQLVAPLTSTQTQGIANTNSAVGDYQPYFNTAANYATTGASPISAGAISGYENPFQSDVINSTLAQINQTNGMQQQQVVGNAALQGALGGDRVKIAQGVLAGQQDLANNATLANLNATNYSQALSAAQADRAAAASGANTFMNLGSGAQNLALTGAGAQLGAGAVEQNTQQQGLTAAYNQYLQQLAFPYQNAQFLAQIGLPAAGLMGGTTNGQGTTTTQGPSIFNSILGGGLALAGALIPKKSGGAVRGYDLGGPVNFMDVPSYIPHSNGSFQTPQQYKPTLNFGSSSQGQSSNPLSNVTSLSNIFKGSQAVGGALFPGAQDKVSDFFQDLGDKRGGRIKPKHYDDGGFVFPDASDFTTPSDIFSADRFAQMSPDFGKSDSNTAFPPVAGEVPALPAPVEVKASPTDNVVTAVPDATTVPAATRNPMSSYGDAISGIESGGNYKTLGPVTNSGDRAFGKYQIMGSNIGPWSKEVFGVALTPDQFLSSPQAQDAVFKNKFGQYVSKYGPEGAAKAWFAGEGGMNDPNRKDQLGTSVASYGAQFLRRLGVIPTDNASPTTPADRSAIVIPQTGQPESHSVARTLFGHDLSDNARQAIIAAGLGMMASRSPFVGQAIGEGGLAGLNAYGQATTRSQAQQRVDLEAKRMAQQAEQFAKTFGLKQEQFGLSKETQARTNLQPVKIGTDVLGRDVYGVRSPKDGSIHPIDPTTGRILNSGETVPGPFSGQASASPTVGMDKSQFSTFEPPKDSPIDISSVGKIDHPVNDEMLKSLNPATANMVKLLAEGRIAPPTSFAASKPYWQGLLTLAAQYDPKFDATNYSGRQSALKDMTSGKSAQNITSFNTAIGHLDALDKSIGELKNTSYPMFNRVANAVKPELGDTKLKSALNDFNTKKRAVVDELTRAFRGSSGNVHDIKGWEETINSADSPEALHAAIKAATELLRSRIEAVTDQYRRAFGSTRDPIDFLSPKAKETFQRLSGEGGERPSKTPSRVRQNGHVYERQSDGSYKAVE